MPQVRLVLLFYRLELFSTRFLCLIGIKLYRKLEGEKNEKGIIELSSYIDGFDGCNSGVCMDIP
jgi:hypothetical protein